MLNSGEPLPLGSSAERALTRDAAGGMANNGQFQLRYDERNRLDRVVVGELTTSYGVNGLGERTTKDGRPTFGVFEHVYDLSGQLLGLYKSGALDEEIVWLGGKRRFRPIAAGMEERLAIRCDEALQAFGAKLCQRLV